MSAEVVEALQRLYHDRGRLDPVDVVDEARDPDSVLHDRFEWDDSVAAHLHRLQQARALIRSVRIERAVAADEPPRRIRAFVHDPVNDGYIATEDVARIPNLRDRILDEMRGDLERLQSKWKLYKETFDRIAAEVLLESLEEPEEVVDRTRTGQARSGSAGQG